MNTLNNLTLVTLAVIAAVTVLTGCGKENPSFSILPEGDSFKQSRGIFNNQLDILWVIDNSGSMSPYQQNLVNNFNSFIANFRTKGYDFKISVTTTQAYLANQAHQNNQLIAKFRDGTDQTSHTGIFTILPTTPNMNNVFVVNATQGTSGTGDERAFESFKETLNSPTNAGFLRSQSFLAVIILSDEDDFSGVTRCQGCGASRSYSASSLDSVNSYVSYLDTLTRSTAPMRRYNVSNISVTTASCQQQYASTGSIMGTRYMELTAATDGVSGSLCDSSYAGTLDAIQAKITELSTQFYLERIPQVDTIRVKVNGVNIAQNATNGWVYNSGPNSIVFRGSAIPPQDSTIEINYVPMTVRN
ncbi:MAG: hypothetical protein SGI74_01730 [Oligoflexia bacterium]|nr:hypothetical protein [Oligoflexia bacterium]